MLASSFALLPNLQEIAALEESGYLGGEATKCDLFEQIVADWLPSVPPFQRKTRTDLPKSFDQTYYKRHEFAKVPMSSLIVALGTAEIKLQTLEFGILPYSFWEPGSLWAEVEPFIRSAFQHLNFLDLNLCTGYGPPETRVWWRQAAAFIHAAPALQKLRLWFDSEPDTGEMFDENSMALGPLALRLYPDVAYLFELLTSPRLLDLKIGDCRMNRASFVSYMDRHTWLNSLALGVVSLLETHEGGMDVKMGSWERAFKYLAPKLNLERVCIQKIQDETTRKTMWEWIGVNQDAKFLECHYDAYRGQVAYYLLQQGIEECPECGLPPCTGAGRAGVDDTSNSSLWDSDQ